MSPTDLQKASRFTANPLFWLSIVFAAGIVAGRCLDLPSRFSLAVCIGGAVAAFFSSRAPLAVVLLLISFLFAGSFSYQFGTASLSPTRIGTMIADGRILPDDIAEIDGMIEGRPEETPGGFFIKVVADRVAIRGTAREASGKLRVFVALSEGESAELRSRVRFLCRLTRANTYNNPGGIPREEILDAQGFDATCSLKSRYLLEDSGPALSGSTFDFVFGIRERLIGEFRARFSVSTAGVMIASLLGSKYFLDRPTAELFRDGGTFHVLVISGLHITFIGGLSLVIVRMFTRRRIWHFILASSFLWAFSFAVGAEVPVIRAALMFTILLFSQVIERRGSMLNSLGFCALAMLAWRPEDLFSQSFQLTYLSVLSLVAGAFPLIGTLREIGEWQPTASTPLPPDVPRWLALICETIYWNDGKWRIEKKRNIWTGEIRKLPLVNVTRVRVVQAVLRYLFEGILVSLLVQIWLLPLSAMYFNRVAFSSVILNLWVGVIIAFESFAAVTAIIIAQFSETVALPVVYLTEFLNAALLALPAAFVNLDLAGIRVPAYTGVAKAVYVLFYVPLLFVTIAAVRWRPLHPATMLSAKRRKLQRQGALIAFWNSVAVLTLCLVVVLHPYSAPRPDGRLRVDFLDVGQGDSALVTFPNGQTMLIDGGGRPGYGKKYVQRDGMAREVFDPDAPTIGETVVSRFLWSRGYSSVDYVVATHADADHIQGLSAVLQNFRVGAAFVGRTPFEDEDYAAFLSAANRRRVPIVVGKRGDVLKVGDAEVEFLFPAADESAGAASDNNHSVVIKIRFGARSFLMTGDIERKTEKKLVGSSFLRSDVVKVAHHGSRTSSTREFIDATTPAFAVFSVGRTSPFGHPHPEIIERWSSLGARILTTGESGTITVSTDGRDLIVEKYLR